MINFEWKIDDVKFDICIGIESRWSMSLNLQVKIGNRNWLLLLIVLVWNCNFEGCYHIPIVKSRVSKCGWKSKTDFGYDSQRVWLKANTVNALKLAHVLEIEGLEWVCWSRLGLSINDFGVSVPSLGDQYRCFGMTEKWRMSFEVDGNLFMGFEGFDIDERRLETKSVGLRSIVDVAWLKVKGWFWLVINDPSCFVFSVEGMYMKSEDPVTKWIREENIHFRFGSLNY